jgi:hypothetical protein
MSNRDVADELGRGLRLWGTEADRREPAEGERGVRLERIGLPGAPRWWGGGENFKVEERAIPVDAPDRRTRNIDRAGHNRDLFLIHRPEFLM